VAHRDPRWFDDPEAFRPERWDDDLARRLPRGAYFPFGDGPRICIGNLFAMQEAVLILATVLRRYRLEPVPNYQLELLPSITIRPKDGLPMQVRQRQPAPMPQASALLPG
jgi:cytochrome P450